MNIGEIRTAVYAILGEVPEDVSIFQFGEAFDAAQLQMVSMLPIEAIPELMTTSYADRSSSVLSEGSIQLPERFYSLEFVQFALTRAGDGSVDRKSARVLDPAEFELLTDFGTNERVASATHQRIRFSPMPAESGTAGQPKAIKMVYKMIPKLFQSARRWQTNGTFPDLYQHNDSPRVFDVYANGGGGINLAGMGVESVEEIIGGRVFIGPPIGDAEENVPVYEATIVDCIDGSPIQIVVSDDDTVPVPDDSVGTTARQPCLLLPKKIGEAGTSVLADEDLPDFTNKWHPHLIDLTAVRLLTQLRRYNEAGALMQFLNQKIAAMGVDVFFTMPETPQEEGR